MILPASLIVRLHNCSGFEQDSDGHGRDLPSPSFVIFVRERRVAT